jgi:hypothetical protein
MPEMQSYIVLYYDGVPTAPGDSPFSTERPFSFACIADDSEHAEEQCLNAEPEANIVWVLQTNDAHQAYEDYECEWNLQLARYLNEDTDA